MKKIIVLIFMFCFILSLSSCGEYKSIAEVKEALKNADWYSDGYSEKIKYNYVANYGDTYIFVNEVFSVSIEGEPEILDYKYYFSEQDYIVCSNRTNFICLCLDRVIPINYTYSMGYLVKEDILDLGEKFKENNYKITKDLEFEPINKDIKRCIHKYDNWKVVDEHRLEAKCLGCDKKIIGIENNGELSEFDKELYSLVLKVSNVLLPSFGLSKMNLTLPIYDPEKINIDVNLGAADFKYIGNYNGYIVFVSNLELKDINFEKVETFKIDKYTFDMKYKILYQKLYVYDIKNDEIMSLEKAYRKKKISLEDIKDVREICYDRGIISNLLY